MKHRILSMIIFAMMISFAFGCGDNKTTDSSPIFNEPAPPKKEKKKEKPKATIKKTPQPKNNNSGVNKQDEQIVNALNAGKKWLDVVKVLQDTARNIYMYYFENSGKYGDLASGQNIDEIYKSIKKGRAPKMSEFEPKDFILSKIIPGENRLIFTVTKPETESQSADMMRFDITPKWARMKMSYYFDDVLFWAQSVENNKFDAYKWVEAENLLLGMQVGFMFFLFENEYTEFDNIDYPMDLSALAGLIEYDIKEFQRMKFFNEKDFKLQNFNFITREFLFTATPSKKAFAPRGGTVRTLTRSGWYEFKKKEVEPEVKNENKDEPYETKKEDEVKKTEKEDNPKETEPKVTNPNRLPSIDGKKVKLTMKYNLVIKPKKNARMSELENLVPVKPYDYIDRFKKILEEMGATVVKNGEDAEIVVKIDIEVDATTFMEKIFNVKLYGKINVSSSFGEKQNSFNGSFNERDNEMERCFENIWDDGVNKFEKIVKYAFASK